MENFLAKTKNKLGVRCTLIITVSEALIACFLGC